MNHKYVTCTGFGGTGSSVISDLLKEFSNVKSCGANFEMSMAFDVGGISDLQHYLVDDFERNKVTEGIYMFKKHLNAISDRYTYFLGKDFYNIVSSYLDNLILVEWNGENEMQYYRYGKYKRWLYYSYLPRLQSRIRYKFMKEDGYEHTGWFKKKLPMQITVPKSVFFDETRKMYKTLLDTFDKENGYEYLCFDQLVPAYNFKRYLNYFPNMKIIVVDRDPRDLYLLNELYWHEAWIPSHKLDIYIKWFEEIRRDIEDEIYHNSDNVLFVHFEDTIYKYDETIPRIMNFLGLTTTSHISPRTYFVPEESKRNTKLWEKVDKRKNEIEEIEKSLKKYCYRY